MRSVMQRFAARQIIARQCVTFSSIWTFPIFQGGAYSQMLLLQGHTLLIEKGKSNEKTPSRG